MGYLFINTDSHYFRSPIINPYDPDYVPSVFMFIKPAKGSSCARNNRREQREKHEQKQIEERERAKDEQRRLGLLELEAAEGLLMIPTSVATQTETVPTADFCQQVEVHRTTIGTQTTVSFSVDNNQVMEEDMSPSVSAEFLKEDNLKTEFYTGLTSWAVFMQLFSLLSPSITPSRTRLSLQDKLVLALMKLWLNVPFQDLAYRWRINVSTVTRLFRKWIAVMSERIKFLIK